MRQRQKSSKIPVLRKFWQRALFFVVAGIVSGLLIYWLLSSVDPLTLVETGGFGSRRRALIRLTLSLMSPAAWGWFWFIVWIVGGFGSDWYYHRFKDLPDETTEVPKSAGQ